MSNENENIIDGTIVPVNEQKKDPWFVTALVILGISVILAVIAIIFVLKFLFKNFLWILIGFLLIVAATYAGWRVRCRKRKYFELHKNAPATRYIGMLVRKESSFSKRRDKKKDFESVTYDQNGYMQIKPKKSFFKKKIS